MRCGFDSFDRRINAMLVFLSVSCLMKDVLTSPIVAGNFFISQAAVQDCVPQVAEFTDTFSLLIMDTCKLSFHYSK